MFLYIIKWSLIYIILISLFHYLFNFFQKTLTTNKTKDILNYSNNQYTKINNLLNNNNNYTNTTNNNSNSNNSNSNNSNSNNSSNNSNTNNLEKNMEFELQDFLNKLNSK